MGSQSVGQGLFHILLGGAEHPNDLSESHCLQMSKEEKEDDRISFPGCCESYIKQFLQKLLVCSGRDNFIELLPVKSQ